jgi:hypothetical protein
MSRFVLFRYEGGNPCQRTPQRSCLLVPYLKIAEFFGHLLLLFGVDLVRINDCSFEIYNNSLTRLVCAGKIRSSNDSEYKKGCSSKKR